MATSSQDQQADAPTCYRHPGLGTHVQCVRCNRYICPNCARPGVAGERCGRCFHVGGRTFWLAGPALGGRTGARPVMTYSLIGVNVLAYLAEVVNSGIVDQFSDLGNGVAPGGSLHIPANGGFLVASPQGGTMYEPAHFGFLWPGFHFTGIAHGQWYRLITSPFLHVPPTQLPLGPAHILANMMWLWILGPAVERVTGRLRFAALYLVSALGCSAAAYLIAPDTAGIGASGAIFGLVGAYFVFSRRLGSDLSYATQLIIWALVWLVASAWFTSWPGHLGGLLTGTALAAAFAYAPAKRRRRVQVAATVGILTIVTTLVALKTAQIDASGLANFTSVTS